MLIYMFLHEISLKWMMFYPIFRRIGKILDQLDSWFVGYELDGEVGRIGRREFGFWVGSDCLATLRRNNLSNSVARYLIHFLANIDVTIARPTCEGGSFLALHNM